MPDVAAPRRWPWGLAVAGLLIASLLLRLWGVKQGLPYAYNTDENAHFVPKAMRLFGHGWNPHYFVNPPVYTYLLHVVFAIWFGGGAAVQKTFATNPTEVFVVARVTAAVCGTLAVWMLYLAGSRFFDRRVGLLAAGLFGVAFLPVFYAHLALNDVPTLLPICVSLWGTAGILRLGRTRDYVMAGAGLGIAAATKYTGGIVLLPLVGAAGAQYFAPRGKTLAIRGLVFAGVTSIIAFFIVNPYAVLSFSEFRNGLDHQTSVAEADGGKLGLTQTNGLGYYLWTFTWGLGWVPALAALAGAVRLWVDERRLIGVLVPAPIIFLIFMGSQSRFFGRWLMPVFPIVCLLGAYFVLEAADWASKRRPALRPTLVTLACVALLGQGVVYSLHSGLVLSRADTRNLARGWLVHNVPEGTKIVVEPNVPDQWAQDIANPSYLTGNGNRWVKFSTSRSTINNDGSELAGGQSRIVNVEDYERTLRPSLIDTYEADGFCYVITGSTQSGRADAQPKVVPQAIAYYKRLKREGQLVHQSSPYAAGEGPVGFNFDWSFDFYPLAYERPGPVMSIYKLKGGRCAGA